MTKDEMTKRFPGGLSALKRLLAIAQSDTGQSLKVSDFLLAWYNAFENGKWDPTDLWAVDKAIAADIIEVLAMMAVSRTYPDGLGFKAEIEAVWKLWRGGPK